jgi:hypothetical protein
MPPELCKTLDASLGVADHMANVLISIAVSEGIFPTREGRRVGCLGRSELSAITASSFRVAAFGKDCRDYGGSRSS